jgi:hypothetical protein
MGFVSLSQLVVTYVVLIMEVLTAALMKAAVFWNVRPCGLVDSYYLMEEPAAAVRPKDGGRLMCQNCYICVLKDMDSHPIVLPLQ